MRADAALQAAARSAGLLAEWEDVSGRPCTVSPDVLRAVLAQLQPQAERVEAPLLTAVCGESVVLPAASGAAGWVDEAGWAHDARPDGRGGWTVPDQPGYWHWQQGQRSIAIAVAPQQAWWPAQLGRVWGLAAQVYSLRGEADAGIGDSAGCAPWLQRLREQGGHALALSPMHAGLPPTAGYSPYSPSDRRWLDPLQASLLQGVPDAARAALASEPALVEAVLAATAARRIDWPGAADLKWRWLRRARAEVQHQQPVLWRQISQWRSESGPTLQAYCALATDPRSGDADDHAFAQWMARRCWSQLQQEARRDGAAIGLIADLAVGCAPDGAEARSQPQAMLAGLELGAPPDAFNTQGQAWGITGFSPLALRNQGYAPFINLLRAVMADRGGIRIDHILGLHRLWVLPRGASAGEGVYLQFPLDDLLNLLVLESWRHQCVVIGEDLGVVPAGIRQQLASRGVLGVDVLPFTRDASGFLAPAAWRRDAVAMPSTHDLPPLAGWLRGRDLRWRARLGEMADLPAAMAQRRADALALAQAAHGDDVEDAALERLAATPSRLALLPLEDALGLRTQVNLPGTVGVHPNWRRRLPLHGDEPALQSRLGRISAGRGGAGR
ncbi:4-alpha-glucanotransferase [Stenotrophomonas sp. ZAC14D2_NAIMI4_7]|uniref:4-alpha-glucanotransferase n=1 Tax=Stenotrophomonas sp. ZAC14D2_NAIMI4_7 TaxID=2072405 RepID=UPI000D541816|nr:4-alpha-glucanotransferase [Stenotrophomonas sp. ZAC14D2_NAIMI4_7]AWH19630.1 4-alpha-glucanotransferase [Stenotrophomonas sp. ZAC14D2_NAIMI4_7]